MRAALWLMALFAIAVATALFAGNNPGTVTLFWSPHRIDLSLNFFLLLLAGVFLMLHLAMRAMSALMRIPQQARRWRLLQKERAMHTALLDSLSHLVSGRFIRARKAAELVVSLEESLLGSGEKLAYSARLRTLAHLVAAEGAHALQDRVVRDAHFAQALEDATVPDAHEAREGVQLRRARWALDDRDAHTATQWLDQLPVGASRRTVALRMRFRAARQAGQPLVALESARLLTKHRAFTEAAGKSIARGLAVELIRSTHDAVQIQRVWDALEKAEKQIPDVAFEAAERLVILGGDAAVSRRWVLPVWESMVSGPDALALPQRIRLARVLERGFDAPGGAPDAEWLNRIETAQMGNPRDAVLQYLAGVVCMRLSLWGKAQQLLKQSLSLSQESELRRDAWLALAQMADQRQDVQVAAQAYREAAKK
jgi:HemY protein